LKWSKLIVLVVVVCVGALIVWRISSGVPGGDVSPKDKKSAAAEPNKPGENKEGVKAKRPKRKKESDEPKEAAAEPNKPEKTGEPNKPGDANKPSEANDPMENLNLKDVEIKDIIKTIAEWTGKVIIPVDDAMKKKITIYSEKKLARSHALALIYSALREQGIVAEEKDSAIILRPIADIFKRSVPTVPDDVPLASLKNKDEVVQKFFKLKNYSPTQLQKLVQPMMPEHGYVYAIENTSHLVVIDTVASLEGIQQMIDQLDVPETKETVTRWFEIKEGDPVEIVQLLNILIGNGEVGSPGRPEGSRRSSSRRPSRSSRNEESKPAGSVVLGRTDSDITLIPVVKRKWIIAKASAEDMVEIERWIKELDAKKPEEREHTLVKVEFADVEEVADQINNMLATMPLKANVTVQPLKRAKQVMIVGSAENREMVQQLVSEIDKPTEQFLTEHIPLKYADPEQVKTNLEELYTQFSYYESRSRYGNYSSRYSQGRGMDDPDTVRVIAYPTLKQVTVIASAENMEKIKKQIAEWDKPVDIDDVAPAIIELKNSDPVKMVDLLTRLFTETERRMTYMDYIFGRGSVTKTMVGPLYGQLAFEAVPDTKKIIVQSKVAEGYAVVRKLVTELDREEMAEVPTVIILKYADPEDLSERLNAMFNEPGTNAPIRLSRRGLSDYSMTDSGESNRRPQSDGGGGGGGGGSGGNAGEYRSWWNQGYQRRMDEMPLSNVIGRVRFVPDPRSKAILVLSPPAFVARIEETINDLDVPGRQVRVKATILMVDHRDLTSLGLQLATNPLAFGSLDEDAITALTTLNLLEERGSLTITGEMNVTTLIDFLVKKVNAKVLNQQTLWTKDNEEADFFRGQTVAFTTTLSVSDTGGRATSGVEFQPVGMTLRVRPNITPEKNVDMTLNLMISQLTSDIINQQPVRSEMNTQTTLIVGDTETIMLGGMLFQEDSRIERKIPLLGDIPLLGGLFRHNEVVKANAEILVFVTPYVIDEETKKMPSETLEQLRSERERLEGIMTDLDSKVKGVGK